ncbi:MAG: carboxypeptidase regulatory-like domain-containing protein [Opitutaceae bacterium]|nr:carboxypeptidase regulatory-like domain-containing protein [Opitutaceae bacterium]
MPHLSANKLSLSLHSLEDRIETLDTRPSSSERARHHAVAAPGGWLPPARRARAAGGWLAGMLAVAIAAHAAESPATGTIEGRIMNSATGENLENARVTVSGTPLETFSGFGGHYRVSGVPAGAVQLRVFYTGLPLAVENVTMEAGRTVQREVDLAATGAEGAATADGVLKMSRFTVSSSKEMSGAAIAINEQRFAPNVKTVVSTDEFGTVAEGHAGEFLKFLPGIAMDYAGGNARGVSINGVPADYVPVTVDGFNLATAIGDNTSRTAAVDMVSINSLSRIEVLYSPTPESPGSALAGSVNMVPRSAFDRARPEFNGSVYLMMRDQARDFGRSPSPRERPTRKVFPGFDFSYARPVNRRFGFTVSGGHSTQYAGQDFSQNTWRGASAATNGNAFPHTTPDQPYLTDYTVRDGGKITRRNSLGATVDYKFTPHDTVTVSLQASSFVEEFNQRALALAVGRVQPGNFSSTATRGAAGAGTLQATNQGNDRLNRTYMPTITWRHSGPVWKADAGLGLSHATYEGSDASDGFFNSSTVRRTGVTVSFDDIFYLRPNTITVTDGATGVPVDPYRLDSYVVTAVGGNIRDSADTQRTAFLNARRDFATAVPFALKGGLDVRQSIRDLRPSQPSLSFVGRDSRPSTVPQGSDDLAAAFWAPGFSQRPAPYGFPRIEWVSNYALHDYYTANPAHFTADPLATYRNEVNNSKHAEEIISAAYIRSDVQLLQRRLKLIGGLRVEQTNVEAEGPLTDPTRNVQRDAAGRPVTGPNGRPLPLTTDPLEALNLTLVERGARTEKEYLRLFPNLNANYSLRENLIVRGSYYFSVGRPNFNQYAGGITLPDMDSPPTAGNRITVNNAGIKAWSARSMNARLEYYFEGVGQVSVGAFRRDIENFFGSTVFAPTPEFLALYGLDPAIYGEYDVATQRNLPGTVRMTGVDVSYKQALTFLPAWARGVQVFANGSAQRATGEASDNFAGYLPRSGSWGVSLTRPAYNLRVNWNYRGRHRRGVVATGGSIEPGTYNWGGKRLYVDVSGEYYVWKRLALFMNLRNIGDATEDAKVYGPSTPAHANFRSRLDFGSLWTFGLKGRF